MQQLSDFSKAKVGDRAWSYTKQQYGEIQEITNHPNYPIVVKFEGYKNPVHYTLDGRFSTVDKFGDLFWDKIEFPVPERPRRMVKKTIDFWVNINPDGAGGIYSSEDEANTFRSVRRIGCAKFTHAYEVEE